MTTASSAKLYTPQLLALAMRLGQFPLDTSMPLEGKSRGRSCGSTLLLRLSLDQQDRIDAISLQASACAVGQASAAIFAANAKRLRETDIASALIAFENWLNGEAIMPDWPDLHLLAPAREYPARHGAMLLPWRAALDALSKA